MSFLGAGISDYGDLLFAPGREAECASVLRQFLAERRRDWDVLDLQEVRSGSAMTQIFTTEPCSVCPVLDLSTFPTSMDRKLKTDARRAREKLSKTGTLQFICADEQTYPQLLHDFFKLYSTRWGKMDAPLERFHCEAAPELLQTGHLRLWLLKVDERPAAAIYAFTSGATLYCYLSGFEPELAKLSPGVVLLQHVIEEAVSEGLREVDFLRHPEAYKYLWGARDRINYAIRSGRI